MQRRARGGFTPIEVIITIVILLLIVAIALPAMHHARESSRRAHCQSNLKDSGLALHNYESAYKRFPSGGKGTYWEQLKVSEVQYTPAAEANPVLVPNGTAFDSQSTFTTILPYFVEFHPGTTPQGDLPCNTDQETPPGQQTRNQASQRWGKFLCPSNPIGAADPAGYGQTDYAPTVFVDIAITGSLTAPGSAPAGTYDPATPTSRRSRLDGFLALGGTPFGLITDGTSNTIAVAESAGRGFAASRLATSPHRSPAGTRDTCGSADGTASSGYRCPNRWADPDNALGLSGPPPPLERKRVINNHSLPIGGPPECPWSTENCGPNDEIFSFHTGGAQAVLGDGAVKFLSENMDPAVVAKLVARADSELVDLPGCGSYRRTSQPKQGSRKR